MKIMPSIGVQIVSMFCVITAARACVAADTYTDGKLKVEWAQTSPSYTGTFTFGSQQFPATAYTTADGIAGSFESVKDHFPFIGKIAGDTFTLSTGTTTYVLKAPSPPVNPLSAGNTPTAPNPLSAPGAAAAAPAVPPGYAVIISNDSGKAMSTQKAGIDNVPAALESTFPDLDHYFGVKSTIGSAYQDAKDPKSGGATFSSTLNGQPVKGIVSCKVVGQDAAVAVIYARTDTTKAEWDKLTSPPQTSVAAAGQAAALATPKFPLKEFDFPDGTGSLSLADGWTTQAQTCINPVYIKGPADQGIVLNNMSHIDTPDSPLQQSRRRFERMQEQMAANARAQGRKYIPMPTPPGPPPVVSPYLEPAEALKAMIPQFSKVSEYNHGPSTTLDSIVSVKDAPSALANGKAAIILYTYTQTLNGEAKQFRRSIYLQTAPQGQTGWVWLVTGVAAPDATFDNDAPLMFAMMNSLKVNPQQFTKNLDAQTQTNMHDIAVLGDAENKVLQTTAQMGQDNLNTQRTIGQEQHQAQMDGYHAHNAQWAADETNKQQLNADYIETIKGTRLVYDTQTGASGYANLSDVTGVVDSLNQAALDPNRFVQVPLRDYLYAPTPVPSR